MKAWRLHSANDFRLDDVPAPQPKKGEILVKVMVAQASVTEAIAFKGAGEYLVRLVAKLLESGPVRAYGHEFSGLVTAVGEGVTGFKPGDRVASMRPTTPCGKCSHCASGRDYVCFSGGLVGAEIPGVFAEYAAMPASVVVRIPPSINWRQGACIQPLDTSMASALMAKEAGRLDGYTVVLGQGPIGLGITQFAKALGARTVIATDVKPKNLRLAADLGADHVIDASREDVVKRVRELTGGHGADVALDAASGDPKFGLSGVETFRQALEMTTQEGLVVQPAIATGTLDQGFSFFRNKRLVLAWPRSITPEEGEQLVDMVAKKKVQVEPTITHVVEGLEEVPKAIEITAAKHVHGAVNPCQVVISS